MRRYNIEKNILYDDKCCFLEFIYKCIWRDMCILLGDQFLLSHKLLMFFTGDMRKM